MPDSVDAVVKPPPAAIAIVNEFDIRRPSLRKQRQHLPTVSVEVPFCLSGTPSAHVVRLDQPYREESHATMTRTPATPATIHSILRAVDFGGPGAEHSLV